MEDNSTARDESENLADILNGITDNSHSDWTQFRKRLLAHPGELAFPLAQSSAVTVFRAICDREDLPLYIFEMAVDRYPREVLLQRFQLSVTVNSVLYKQLESSRQRVDEMIFLLLRRCPEAILDALEVHMECMRVAIESRLPERRIFLMKFTCRKVLDAAARFSPRRKPVVDHNLHHFFSSNWGKIHSLNAQFRATHDGKDDPLFLYQRDNLFTLMTPSLENLEYATSSCKNSPLYDILSPLNNSQLIHQNEDELIKYAIRFYKHHLVTRNDAGETPLYFLLKRSTSHIKSKQRASLLFDLLKTEPGAASIPNNVGRLPFYKAIRGKDILWNRNLRMLLEAAPNASKTRDMISHMYPFMEAAIGEKSDLLTVFSLLKKHPEAARGLALIGNENTKSSVSDEDGMSQSTNLGADENIVKRPRLD